MTAVEGPFFEDLGVGDRLAGAPRVTLTEGLAAAHHAIVGGRLKLAFDAPLALAVAGGERPLASPALVWDIAIGQSTLATRQAIANLFYRGLSFLAAPRLGDTLETVTTIVGLRPLSPRPDRPPRGLAVMRIETTDQDGRRVLDFHRCAMLPARLEGDRAAAGTVELPSIPLVAEQVGACCRDWRLDPCAGPDWAPHFADVAAGATFEVTAGDLVSSAPELARLTFNLAAIHHDAPGAGGERLVYGGHTIGLALAQATRALPSLLTVVAWQDCDHLGPVREGDTLHSTVTVERCTPRKGGGGFVHLRSQVRATGASGGRSDVLDWRFVGLLP